jgi:predicted TIM-barrel fold metal-dependent hydrolase
VRTADWVKQGAGGVRLSPTLRSHGGDPLAIWRKARELGIVVSSRVAAKSPEGYCSPEFEEVITAFPDLKFVMEHLGWGGDDRSPGLERYRKVLELAKYPNTYMKVPGLAEFCGPRPKPLIQPMPFPEVPPLIEMALEAFGPKRLMWGSDYPPSSRREGYANALKWPMEYVKFKSEEDKEWVFGKTADTLWKFQ